MDRMAQVNDRDVLVGVYILRDIWEASVLAVLFEKAIKSMNKLANPTGRRKERDVSLWQQIGP